MTVHYALRYENRSRVFCAVFQRVRIAGVTEFNKGFGVVFFSLSSEILSDFYLLAAVWEFAFLVGCAFVAVKWGRFLRC